jgi:Xaa-Pro aminopeptidase
MRENKVDMWIHVMRVGNPDALAKDLALGIFLLAPVPETGSTSYFVFTDRGGDRIERAILAGAVTRGEGVYDVFGSEEDLGKFVAERDPKCIAVNMSGWLAVADGLSHTGYERLVAALGNKYAERLVSAERVISDFRDRRVTAEVIAYGRLAEATRQLIERALSNEVITPDVTTREDVGWWMTEQMVAMGVEAGYSWLGMPAVLYSESPEPEYRQPSYVFRRGDLFQFDWGFEWLNLGTDMKRTAYILEKGEMAPPPGLQRAWDLALKARQVLRENIKVGQTGSETLERIGWALEGAGFIWVNLVGNPLYHGGWDAVWEYALKARGVGPEDVGKTEVSLDCHCVGNTGNSQIEPGPAFSGFRTGRGHLIIHPNHLFAFELFAKTPIPEFGGAKVRFGIEDDAIVTEDGVQFLYPPNSKILLIH